MKVNIRSVFKICRNVNCFWNFHSTFFFFLKLFFKAVLFPYISLFKIWWKPFLFSSFWHFSSSSFFLSIVFFFLLWILAQTTTLKQTDQIPSWNTMDKGYKKERLIKRLNRVASDNVSRKKKQNTYMAQSRQKWPNLISQRLV